jgi:hypothetical protein
MVLDRAKQMLMLENDRGHVLREMIYVCRPAGVISIPGVYSGLVDKVPMGIAMNKGLTFRMGQTNVNRWSDDLLRRIEADQIDPFSSRIPSVSRTDRRCIRSSGTSRMVVSRSFSNLEVFP